MAAKSHDFKAALPEVIYWDASFILNFIIEDAKYQNECANFARRLRKENITSVVSSLTLDEIWYGILRVRLIEELGARNWIKQIRKNPITIKKYVSELQQVSFDLSQLPHLVMVETTTEMIFKALDLMGKYALLPRDAIHISTALTLGIKNIVTTDPDFERVDDLIVYTCNPEILERFERK